LNSGLNGQVSYTITSGDETEDFEIFPNGTIYTKQLLDREAKSNYNLIITATDRAEDVDKRLSSTAQVGL
jgi:protocadherin Fat 4